MSKHLGIHLRGIRTGKKRFSHHHELQNAILTMSNKHFAVLQDVIQSAATGKPLSDLFHPVQKNFDHLKDAATQLLDIRSPLDLAKKHRETPGSGWGIGGLLNGAKDLAKIGGKAAWSGAKTAGKFALKHPQLIVVSGQMVSSALDSTPDPRQREERAPPPPKYHQPEPQAIDELWNTSDDDDTTSRIRGGQLSVSDDLWII